MRTNPADLIALILLRVVQVPSHLTVHQKPLDVPKYRESLRQCSASSRDAR
jgi:hypothetical protein